MEGEKRLRGTNEANEANGIWLFYAWKRPKDPRGRSMFISIVSYNIHARVRALVSGPVRSDPYSLRGVLAE